MKTPCAAGAGLLFGRTVYMQGVVYALLGTLFTFGVTALGALNVFAVRKKTDHTMEALTLGFAGGVMVAASIWSLLIPGMERAKELGQTS